MDTFAKRLRHCLEQGRHILANVELRGFTRVYRSEADCGRLGGAVAIVSFDAAGYVAKLARLFHESAVAPLRQALTRRDLAHIEDGIGFCLPVVCNVADGGVGREGIPRLLLALLVGSTGLLAEKLATLPLPIWGSELNVSGLGDVDALTGGSPLGILDGTGFQVPWWYGCGGGALDDDWQQWNRIVRENFVRGSNAPLSPALTEAADALVQRYMPLAKNWLHWSRQLTDWACPMAFVHFDNEGGNSLEDTESVSPVQYIESGGYRFADSRWRRVAEWQDSSQFCPYGFVVALYVVARAEQESGVSFTARWHMEVARQMLGGCSDMDLLDVKLWGVSATDIEFNILTQEAYSNRAQYVTRDTLSDVWSEPLPDVRIAAWHAMHLNAIVRQRLESVAQRNQMTISPFVGLLAAPLFHSLFVIPYLLESWGDDLRLALFAFEAGNETHEKCKDCSDDYNRRFYVDSPFLKDIPVNHSTSNTLVDWERLDSEMQFACMLRNWLEHDPAAKNASVLITAVPLWMAVVLRSIALVPVIALDLQTYELGAPPTYTHDSVARESYRLFAAPWALNGKLPRGLLVREDLIRGYENGGLRGDYGGAYPFVSLLSMHIRARYMCDEGADVLVMREGSMHRFSPTLRGRLFLSSLRQFESTAAPWRFRLLAFDDVRYTYEELSRYRAAMFVPIVPYGKMTLKDLLTIEMPTFSPSRTLFASIVGKNNHVGKNCQALARDGPAWAYILCRETRWTMFSSLFPAMRYPHIQQFDSIVDLVLKLLALRCGDLERISTKMRRWNAILVADDVKFWHDATIGLAAAAATEEASAGLPFRLPVLPRHTVREAASGRSSGDESPGPEALTDFGLACAYGPRGDEDTCLMNAFRIQWGPFGDGSDGSLSGDTCMVNMSMCSDDILSYGVHLLHDVSGLAI